MVYTLCKLSVEIEELCWTSFLVSLQASTYYLGFLWEKLLQALKWSWNNWRKNGGHAMWQGACDFEIHR
jgi:hypothetical protein